MLFHEKKKTQVKSIVQQLQVMCSPQILAARAKEKENLLLFKTEDKPPALQGHHMWVTDK